MVPPPSPHNSRYPTPYIIHLKGGGGGGLLNLRTRENVKHPRNAVIITITYRTRLFRGFPENGSLSYLFTQGYIDSRHQVIVHWRNLFMKPAQRLISDQLYINGYRITDSSTNLRLTQYNLYYCRKWQKKRLRNLKKFVKRPSADFCHSLQVQVIKIPKKHNPNFVRS